MVDTANAITVTGADGGSTVLSLTGNDFVATHASMFQAMAAQFATVANSFYSTTNRGLLAVGSGLGTVDVTGSGSASAILVSDGTTLSFHGSANATVAAGDGNDTVLAAAGNDTIALGTGSNQVVLGSGNSVVYSEGTDVITAGSGYDTINLAGSSSTVYGGYGSQGYTGTSLKVDDTQGTNSFIFAATKGSLIHGSDVVGGSSNPNFTSVAAFGDATVVGGSATAHVYAGNGARLTLTGNTHDNIMVANDGRWANGNYVYLDGSQAAGGNQLWAGSGNSTLVGGLGADTLVAGGGHTTLSGGMGNNDFDLFKSAGSPQCSIEITDFGVSGGNHINLFGYGLAGAQAALASATQIGGATSLHLNDGSSITLDGVQKSTLSLGNFGWTES